MKRLAVVVLSLLLLSACAAPEEPQPSGPSVRTDWSRLEEGSLSPVGTRFYEAYTDHLIPREDYGILVPYAGLRLAAGWPAESGCLYGLMTLDGAVVVDPVYAGAYRPWGGVEDGQWGPMPLLVLRQGADMDEETGMGRSRYAVAAPDGSWCTGPDYCNIASGYGGLMLFAEDGTFTWMAADGAVQRTWSAEELGITEEQYRSILSELNSKLGWGEGSVGEWCGGWFNLGRADKAGDNDGGCLALRLSDGTLATFSQDQWYDMYQKDAEARGETPGWNLEEGSDGTCVLLHGEERYAIPHPWSERWDVFADGLVAFYDDGTVYDLAGNRLLELGPGWFCTGVQDSFTNEPVLFWATRYSEDSVEKRLYSLDGQLLPFGRWQAQEAGNEWPQTSAIAGLMEELDWNTASYYDLESGECVFRTWLGYEAD